MLIARGQGAWNLRLVQHRYECYSSVLTREREERPTLRPTFRLTGRAVPPKTGCFHEIFQCCNALHLLGARLTRCVRTGSIPSELLVASGRRLPEDNRRSRRARTMAWTRHRYVLLGVILMMPVDISEATGISKQSQWVRTPDLGRKDFKRHAGIRISPHRPNPPHAEAALVPEVASTIVVKLSANISTLPRVLDQYLPKRFDGRTTGFFGLGMWEANWLLGRGATAISLKDGAVSVESVVSGKAHGLAFMPVISCNLEPLYFVAAISARPALGLTNDGWGVVLQNSAVRVTNAPASDHQCFRWPIGKDMSGMIDSAVSKQEQSIKERMSSFFYALPLEAGLAALSRSIEINTDSGKQGCISFNPRTLATTSLKGDFSSVSVLAALGAHPRVDLTSLGCMDVAPERVTPGQPPQDEIFRLLIDLVIPWSEWSGEFPPGSAKAGPGLVAFRYLRAFESNGRLVLAVRTQGALVGELYFWAEPIVRGDTVHFSPFRATDGSRAALTSLSRSTAEQIISSIGGTLDRLSGIDLLQRIQGLKNRLSFSFVREGLRGSVNLNRHTIQSVRPVSNGMLVTVLLEGNAQIDFGDTLVSRVAPEVPKATIWEDADFGGRSLEIFESHPLLPFPFEFTASSLQVNLQPGEWIVFWEAREYDAKDDQLWISGSRSIANLHLLRRPHGKNHWGDRIRAISLPPGGPTGSNENRTVLGP